ncbi:MAG: polysaccharide deacetylase family protein [bacterium]
MRIIYWIELAVAYLFYCTGIYWVRRRRLDREGATVVIVYHRVLDGRRGTGEMVGEDAFARQMDYLARRCRPAAWNEIMRPAGPGLRVLVTFDDGYRDNFTRALPILERHDVPAVFFAVSEFVFNKRRIDGIDEDDAEVIPTAGDLQRAKESPVVSFGNHTATHRLFSQLTLKECDDELARSQAAFRERLQVRPAVFAYPRGRAEDLRDDAARVFEKHTIEAAFTMVPGLVGPGTDRYAIPRIGMSHVNDGVLFRVKLTGLLNPMVNLKNRLKIR